MRGCNLQRVGLGESTKIRQETHRRHDADVGSDAAACREEPAVVEAAAARARYLPVDMVL